MGKTTTEGFGPAMLGRSFPIPRFVGGDPPMPADREEVCRATAEGLERAAGGLGSVGALVGFDGFVDEIVAVVDKRYDAERYDPVETIAAMARKILGASGESSNYELVVKQRKLGGNGPIMANALAALGLDVTYIGNVGYPDDPPGLPRVRRQGAGDRDRRAWPYRRAGVRRRQADARQAPDSSGRRPLGLTWSTASAGPRFWRA